MAGNETNRGETPAPERPTDRVVAHYTFTHTDGRADVLDAFDRVLTVLGRRAQQHREHGNEDLLRLVTDISQAEMLNVERLCEKWEASDRKGLTY